VAKTVDEVRGRLASSLGRRDELPNIALAREIARKGDGRAVRALTTCLEDPDRGVRHDAIKVLYEIGAERPQLIAPYAGTFIDHLSNASNRTVWGAMTALGAIAPVRGKAIGTRIDEVIAATSRGSVITQDWGIRTIAAVAARDPALRDRLLRYLFAFIARCAPRDVPKHAASISIAVDGRQRGRFVAVLRARERELTRAQLSRLRKVYRDLLDSAPLHSRQ